VVVCVNRVGLGGAEYAALEAVKALLDRGHAVDVVLPGEGPLTQRVDSRASVRVVHQNRWIVGDSGYLAALRWLAYDVIVARRQLARLLRDLGADAVITNTISLPAPAFAARSCGIPHLWLVHEYGHRGHGVRLVLGRSLTLRLIGLLSDVVLAVSKPLGAELARYVGAERVRVVHQSVEVPRIDSPPPPGPELRLLLIGSRVALKGQRDAIDALALLRSRRFNVRLDMLGHADTDYEAGLHALVGALGIDDSVRLLPFDEHPEHYYLDTHVTLMCSTGEGFGRVTVEAMKLGRPVVGAADGGTLDVIEDGVNGFLYTPRDVAALAACIEKFAKDPKLVAAMGERAKRTARATYTSEAFGEALEAALEHARRS
jgi:glycosyltransferase involved in cell wall biosynthesis